jgi:hypothetical protein
MLVWIGVVSGEERMECIFRLVKFKYIKMSVPNSQIGMSQEAKLLFQISKQLERLIQVTSGVNTTSTTTTII